MIKLCVYSGPTDEPMVYVTEFNTFEAATRALEFFEREGLDAILIDDNKESTTTGQVLGSNLTL